MNPPALAGVVERRLLVTYRTDPEITARLLPGGLRPVIRNGWSVAGICLLRLGAIRPLGLPSALGLSSENAAHRIAVEWDTPDGPRSGVYIPRRDSASLINVLAGGRVFPGRHHRAKFDNARSGDRLRVAYASTDGRASARVEVRTTGRWAGSELFPDAAGASEFFREGSHGYSPRDGGRQALSGMQLCTDDWRADPVEIESAASSFFDDLTRFPPGTAALDSALLMENIPVVWRALPSFPARPGRQLVTAV